MDICVTIFDFVSALSGKHLVLCVQGWINSLVEVVGGAVNTDGQSGCGLWPLHTYLLSVCLFSVLWSMSQLAVDSGKAAVPARCRAPLPPKGEVPVAQAFKRSWQP